MTQTFYLASTQRIQYFYDTQRRSRSSIRRRPQAVESGQLPVALEIYERLRTQPNEAKYRGYRAWTQYYARELSKMLKTEPPS